jgi:hypothetical protein
MKTKAFDVIDGKAKGIASKLGIDDIDPLAVEEDECTFSDNPEDDVVEDYKMIRKKLRYCMNAGEAILNEALKDVKLNMNARTFEGTSILLKTIVDSGKELLNIHEKLKKIKKIETPKPKADVEKEGEAGSIKGKMSDILDTMDEIDNEDKDHASERDGRTS